MLVVNQQINKSWLVIVNQKLIATSHGFHVVAVAESTHGDRWARFSDQCKTSAGGFGLCWALGFDLVHPHSSLLAKLVGGYKPSQIIISNSQIFQTGWLLNYLR